ncbi:MAG: hypothetical protein V3V19_10660 [Cocleimonas sp.]
MSRNARLRFMLVIAIIFGLYSLAWGLAPFDSINLPARFIIDISDWPLDKLSTPLDRSTQWLSSIGAGLLAAVSIFLIGIVVPAIKENNQQVIRTTVIAMCVWYVIDSAGSVVAGVASNMFFNSVYLLLILIPLLWKAKVELSSD